MSAYSDRKKAENQKTHDDAVAKIAADKGISTADAEKELASRDSAYRSDKQREVGRRRSQEDIARKINQNPIETAVQQGYDWTTRQGVKDTGRGFSDSAKSIGRDASVLSKKVQKGLGDIFNGAKNAGLGNANYEAPMISAIAAGSGPGGIARPQMIQDPRGALVNDPNQFRQYQMSLAQQLSNQAAGRGPSIAQMQLQQGQQANQAAYFSQLASSRNNPLAARTAAMQNQQSQSQLNRDQAIARLAEQQQAQTSLSNLSNQARGSDIQGIQIAQNRAIEQARLGSQFQELQAKYAALGLDREKANQYAAIESEKIRRGIQSSNNQLQGQKLSAAGELVKGGATILGGVYGGPGGAAAANTAADKGLNTLVSNSQAEDDAAMNDFYDQQAEDEAARKARVKNYGA